MPPKIMAEEAKSVTSVLSDISDTNTFTLSIFMLIKKEKENIFDAIFVRIIFKRYLSKKFQIYDSVKKIGKYIY